MNRRIALGLLAIATMFALNALGGGSATAAEEFRDGAQVKISKFNTITNETGGFVLRKQDGDRVYYLECTGQGGCGSKGEFLTKAGTSVGYGDKPFLWHLHKNSSGWSIIPRENGALAVSKNGDKLELQRNQGAQHQVWQIEESR